MKNTSLLFGCSLLLIFFGTSCGDDTMMDDDPIECTQDYTYTMQVEPLISTNCAYSGCHVSSTDGIPDLSNYTGLVQVIEDGRFRTQVLEQMNMPPFNASGPTSLSDEQLRTLECWLEQGYPE